MIDGIIKADGTSRAMRATLPATYEEFKSQAALGNVLLDILYNATGWSQQPTLLNKKNLLKDETATKFGLDSSAVIDDIFAWISQYNRHMWRRKSLVYKTEWETVKTAFSTKYTSQIYFQYTVGTIYYSSSITIDPNTGVLSLKNPVALTKTNGIWDTEALDGKYVQSTDGGIYTASSKDKKDAISDVILTSSDPSLAVGGQGYSIFSSSGYYVMSSQSYQVDVGSWDVVYSYDENAYPHFGSDGSYEYYYAGIPFSNMTEAPRIATGSYTGTGTNSASSPVTLTFNFSPRFILIAPNSYMSYGDSSTHSEKYYFQIWMPGITETLFYKYNGNSTRYMSVNGNTFSFYQTISGNGGATGTLNASGKEYFYVALG